MSYLIFKAVLQSMQYERSKNQEAPASLFSENRYQRATSKSLNNLTYYLKQVN
jgi:hypothetical protein